MMRLVLITLLATVSAGCATYQESEMWRRSTCKSIVDVDERARCLEEATRPENEYKQDREEATKG